MATPTRAPIGRTGLCALGAGFLIAAATASAVVAQGWLPPPPFKQGACSDADANFAARMAFIAAKIKVKAEQEVAWEAFVTATRAAEMPLRDLCQNPIAPIPSHDPVATLEALDRMADAITEHRLATRIALEHLKGALAMEQRYRLAEVLVAPAGMGSLMPPPPPGPCGIGQGPPRPGPGWSARHR